MRRKFVQILLFIALALSLLAAGCSQDNDEPSSTPTPPPSYSTDDLVFGAQEIVETWGPSYGKAELDGEYVKVTTSAPYGGIISGDFRLDFSKRPYVHVKGLEHTHYTGFILRLAFSGYPTIGNTYIISENYEDLPGRELDYRNLHGDFSIDIKDAIYLYAQSPWSAADSVSLIYKSGDVDLDDGVTIIGEDDPKVGTLMMEGDKNVKCRVEIWMMRFEGSTVAPEDAYVRFKEISFTIEEEPAVLEFDIGQESLTEGDERPQVGDEPIQLSPTLRVREGLSEGIIYSSTFPEIVSVNDQGKVEFLQASTRAVGICAIPRANIAKVQNFLVKVQGNIKGAEEALDHLNSLSYIDEQALITPEVDTLIKSDILVSQKTRPQNAAGYYATVSKTHVTARDLIYILNAYDHDNEEIRAVAQQNGGKVKVYLEIPDVGFASDKDNYTYYVYAVSSGVITRLVNGSGLVKEGDDYVAYFEYDYVIDSRKYLESSDIIVIWRDAQNYHVGTYVRVEMMDVKTIAKAYNAEEIANLWIVEDPSSGRITYDEEKGVVRLDVITQGQSGYAFFHSPMISMSELNLKENKVGVIISIDIHEGYSNFRFYGYNSNDEVQTNFSWNYYNDLPGYNFANRTDEYGILNFQAYVFHHHPDKLYPTLDSVDKYHLRFEVQYAPGNSDTQMPYGYMVIRDVIIYTIE